MARVICRSNGTKEVRFSGFGDKDQTIRLGRTSKKNAETFAANLQGLVNAKIAGRSADTRLAEWEAQLPEKLHAKLVAKGVCEPRTAAVAADYVSAGWTVDETVKRFLRTRRDLKAKTREQIAIVGENLRSYFGKDRPLREITVGDAKAFRSWLTAAGHRERKEGEDLKRMAENTVRRRIGRAKQLFTYAADFKQITANPFKELPAATRSNKQRQQFIEAEFIDRVIAAAPRGDWRTIFALSRYGGLRLPSELAGLRWSDVGWASGSITIRAPKTEHCDDGGVRAAPLFPELRKYLEEARELAEEDAEFVIANPILRHRDANLRTSAHKIILRAGLQPWPKTFQNLRASRETELLELYPAKDVAAWLGNSVPVAMEHYAMARSSVFERAARAGATQLAVVAADQKSAPKSAPLSSDQSEPGEKPETKIGRIHAGKRESCLLVTTCAESEGLPGLDSNQE